MKITADTTMKEIIERLKLEEKEVFINPFYGYYVQKSDEETYLLDVESGMDASELKLGDFQKVCQDWNVSSIIEGMNHLEKTSSERKVFYDFKENASEKENMQMMAFPVGGKKPFAVICPGGGYSNVCSLAEGFPIAKRLNELGISAFIVHYRTADMAVYPNPMDDLALAVKYILDHAEEFDISTEDYAVVGFSAGGHLAASFGTEIHGYKKYGLPKPGVMILGYPVITMGEKTHLGSRDMLLGEEGKNNADFQSALSIEKQINEYYPAAYVWQCEKDAVVPIENSQMLVKALEETGIPCKYEVFTSQAHGWGLGTNTEAEGWLDRAVEFWGK